MENYREWPFVSHFIAAPKACSFLAAFLLFVLWLLFGGVYTVQEAELQPPELEAFAEILVDRYGGDPSFYLEEEPIFSGRQTNCYGYSSKAFDDCTLYVYQESADESPVYYLCPRPPEDDVPCRLVVDGSHALSHLAKELGFIEKRLLSKTQ